MYSSALQISGGGDYLLPSQQCIKPLRSLNEKQKTNEKKEKTKIIKKLDTEDEDILFEINSAGKVEKLNPVSISLSDCLACSGCITSSEAILVNNQSIDEFLSVLNSEPKRKLTISLSAESRASLSTHFNLSLKETHQRVTSFFQTYFDAKFILDLSFSRDISLIESAREFVNAYKSSSKYNGEKSSKLEEKKFPIICGSCPGWICYVEKTQEDAIPFLSVVKSPQQIMGSFVKSFLPSLLNEEEKVKEIYHVSVMACYDKKLEASRSDFFDEKNQIRHVDCVLTTTELIDLLRLKNVNFLDLPLPSLRDQPFTSISEEEEITGVKGGSGGYAEFILKYAARELFSISNPIIHSKGKLKNADFTDLWIENESGEILLKFARAYGFRNIQNLVRLIKRKKCEYDYVEVMACPSGCSNGGGQIKPVENQTPKTLAQMVENNYNSVVLFGPEQNQNVVNFYEKLSKYDENYAKNFFFTSFHPIEKTQLQTALKW